MLKIVHDNQTSRANNADCGRSVPDEIIPEGPRQMLAAAMQAEVADFLEAQADQLSAPSSYHGHRRGTTAGAVSSAPTRPKEPDRALRGDHPRFIEPVQSEKYAFNPIKLAEIAQPGSEYTKPL